VAKIDANTGMGVDKMFLQRVWVWLKSLFVAQEKPIDLTSWYKSLPRLYHKEKGCSLSCQINKEMDELRSQYNVDSGNSKYQTPTQCDSEPISQPQKDIIYKDNWVDGKRVITYIDSNTNKVIKKVIIPDKK
jgi:hypothetical protein